MPSPQIGSMTSWQKFSAAPVAVQDANGNNVKLIDPLSALQLTSDRTDLCTVGHVVGDAGNLGPKNFTYDITGNKSLAFGNPGGVATITAAGKDVNGNPFSQAIAQITVSVDARQPGPASQFAPGTLPTPADQ